MYLFVKIDYVQLWFYISNKFTKLKLSSLYPRAIDKHVLLHNPISRSPLPGVLTLSHFSELVSAYVPTVMCVCNETQSAQRRRLLITKECLFNSHDV